MRSATEHEEGFVAGICFHMRPASNGRPFFFVCPHQNFIEFIKCATIKWRKKCPGRKEPGRVRQVFLYKARRGELYGSVRGELGLRMEATKSNPWKVDISIYGYIMLQQWRYA